MECFVAYCPEHRTLVIDIERPPEYGLITVNGEVYRSDDNSFVMANFFFNEQDPIEEVVVRGCGEEKIFYRNRENMVVH